LTPRIQDRELQWLLTSLQDTFASLKSGLSESDALLAPTEPGATLVVSSLRSESVKGLITRVGTRVVKGVSRLPEYQVRVFDVLPWPGREVFFAFDLATSDFGHALWHFIYAAILWARTGGRLVTPTLANHRCYPPADPHGRIYLYA
jgi:hypothetical protein